MAVRLVEYIGHHHVWVVAVAVSEEGPSTEGRVGGGGAVGDGSVARRLRAAAPCALVAALAGEGVEVQSDENADLWREGGMSGGEVKEETRMPTCIAICGEGE
jgi:hypothetical protein